jgi:hypothetical protein
MPDTTGTLPPNAGKKRRRTGDFRNMAAWKRAGCSGETILIRVHQEM